MMTTYEPMHRDTHTAVIGISEKSIENVKNHTSMNRNKEESCSMN